MSSYEDFSTILTYGINYKHYLVQYEGFVNPKLIISDGIYLTQINNQYAIISIIKDIIPNDFDTDFILNLISEKTQVIAPAFKIIYITAQEPYTLLNTSPSDMANVFYFQNQAPLNLTGNGVIAGIIDTGIDYLNEEFIDNNGKTRILEIWDQTIEKQVNFNDDIPFGTVYSSEQIQNAIDARKEGKNPYDIVPSRDTNGHGTNMAGIIAASGKNKSFKGIAPNCNLLVVKLLESVSYKNDHNIKVPIFNITSILPAIEYVKNYALHNLKPIVINLPFGVTIGNHRGGSTLDDYLQTIMNNVGIILVTGSGNEGANDGHVSGTIFNVGEFKIINLIVDSSQSFLYLDLWIDLPNIMSISIFSPSGENTGNIIPTINSKRTHHFIFEDTQIFIKYSLPDELTGQERIRVYLDNIKSGIWRIKLTLVLGENADFNAWLPQRGITEPGTRFSPSEPYGTLTIPSDSTNVITVAAYNQTNNTMLEYSGLGFRYDYLSRIDVVAGATDILTVGLNNSIVAINGTSVATSIVTGLCILLLEWGIIDNNYPYMYSESIRTFLTRGTIKQKGEVYPNPRWGYGIIDFYKVFESIT